MPNPPTTTAAEEAARDTGKVIVCEFRVLPSTTPAVVRLWHLLKYAGRVQGLTCIGCRDKPEPEADVKR